VLRKTNLVMTYASGEPLFDDPCFWAYVGSLANVPDADWVVLTHDIPDAARDRLTDRGLEVADVPPARVHALYRDRHHAFYDYLNHHGHKYKYVAVTDCRDVVFQASPFDWVPGWRARHDRIHGHKTFLDHFVVMAAEGFKMARSGFACIEHFEFQRDVPRPFLEDDTDRWVINGGTFLGTPRAMQDWHFLVWVNSLKTIGRCTDQATVNWLMRHLEHDDTYQVSFPQHDTLCLTGEGVKEGAVEPILKDGRLFNPKNELYHIVHQWDRLDGLKECVLAQYR
jgi:hypothetical protein